MAEALHGERDTTQDAECDVCNTRKQQTALRFCGGCLLTVHRLCYGVQADEGRMFLCQRCVELGPTVVVVRITQTCKVCQGTNGAVRRVGDEWVHVCCALFSPRYRLVDLRSQTFEAATVTYIRTLHCKICFRDNGEAFPCHSCNAAAHYRCAQASTLWDVSLTLTGKRLLACPDHPLPAKRGCQICKGIVREREATCARCEGWVHAHCAGRKLPPFTCDGCKYWADAIERLEKEVNSSLANKGSFPDPGHFLKLYDYLLISRVFDLRALKSLSSPCTNDDLRDTLSLSRLLLFPHEKLDAIRAKTAIAAKLAVTTQELAQRSRNLQYDLDTIRKLEQACCSAGVVLPQLNRMKTVALQSESIAHIKEALFSSQSYSLQSAKATLSAAESRLDPESNWLQTLRSAIIKCEDWLTHYTGVCSPATPLLLADAQKLLAEGQSLPFSLPSDPLKTLETAIAVAEQWERDDRAAFKPCSADSIKGLFKGGKPLVWTTRMADAWQTFERFQCWEARTLAIWSRQCAPPTISELFSHIQYGKSALSHLIDVRDTLSRLEADCDRAVKWRDAARLALSTALAPAHMATLAGTATSLVCTFPELVEVARRAEINTQVAIRLQTRMTEPELLALREEAKSTNADRPLLEKVEARIQALATIRERVRALSLSATELAPELYLQLIADIDAAQLDLPNERSILQDFADSLRWLESYKYEYKLDKSEEEGVLLAACRIQHKHPAAQVEFDRLVGAYWYTECDRIEELTEVSVAEIREISRKLAQIPFDHTHASVSLLRNISDVLRTVDYCEDLSQRPVEALFAGSLQELKLNLQACEAIFRREKVAIPQHFATLFSYEGCIDWCLEVSAVLQSTHKPAVAEVLDLLNRSGAFSLPSEFPQKKALSTLLESYERWKLRYTAHKETLKHYQTDPELLLEVVHTHPKWSVQAVQLLLAECSALPCDCREEKCSLQQDLDRLSTWSSQYQGCTAPEAYEALARAAKRSFAAVQTTDAYALFDKGAREYLRTVAIQAEQLNERLSCYAWNFAALRLLQHPDKTPLQYWQLFYRQIQFIPAPLKDVILIERIRMMESLRSRIDSALRSLSDRGPVLTFDDLIIINEQATACKVVMDGTEYLQSLLRSARSVIDCVEVLIEERGTKGDFQRLRTDLESLQVSIPDTTEKLQRILSAADSLSERAAALRKNLEKSRLPRAEVESVLAESDQQPVLIPGVEELAAAFESSKEVIKELQKSVIPQNLQYVQRCLSRLDAAPVHMGAEELAVRGKLWKLRYRSSVESAQKQSFDTFRQWLAEAEELGLEVDKDLEDLRKYVKIATEVRKRLEHASGHEAQRIRKECQTLPVEIGVGLHTDNSATATENSAEYVPPKRLKTPDAQPLDINRSSSVLTLERALSFSDLLPKDYAKNLAQRAENWLFHHYSPGKNYECAVQEIAKVLERLLEYEGFAERLMAGEVSWKAIRRLRTKDLCRTESLRELFAGEPKLLSRYRKKLEEDYRIPHLNKPPEVKKHEKPVKSHRPTTTIVDIINDFRQFKEQQKPTDPEAPAEVPKPVKKRSCEPPPEILLKKTKNDKPYEGAFSPDHNSAKVDQPEVYRIFDDSLLRYQAKPSGLMYDPASPKPPSPVRAAAGSLLRIWTGVLEYNKQSITVDMLSVDNAAAFQGIPLLAHKVEVTGRTKTEEFEGYLKQSLSAGGFKNIATAWIEPSSGCEHSLRQMTRDLSEKDRVAVIRYDSSLTIYLSVLSDSFVTSLNSMKVNVVQRVDNAVLPHLNDKEKVACFLVCKKSASPIAGLSITVAARAEGTGVSDVKKLQVLSPVSEEEEDDSASQLVLRIISKLQSNEQLSSEDLQQLKSLLLQNQSPEVAALLNSINAQLDRQQTKAPAAENSVTEFLSMQCSAAKSKPIDPRFSYRFS